MTTGSERNRREERSVAKWGHVYQLGAHRVACGPPHYLRNVVENRQARFGVIDPLIGTVSAGDGEDGGPVRSPDPHLMGIFYDALDVMKSVSAPGALACGFFDWYHMPYVQWAREMIGIRSLELLAWNYGDRELSAPTSSSDQVCNLFQTGSGPDVKVPAKAMRRQENLIVPPARKRLDCRLAEKPIELQTWILSTFTKRGDLVLQPNLPDASMLIAAERTGRILAAVDGDPLRVDMVIRRWQRVTGKSAQNLAFETSFDERALKAVKGGRGHAKQ